MAISIFFFCILLITFKTYRLIIIIRLFLRLHARSQQSEYIYVCTFNIANHKGIV